MTVADNRDLYEYLLSLATKLKNRGAEDLGQAVAAASRHFNGISTEFLGESRIALQEVAKAKRAILYKAESDELTEILKQIDYAFDHRH
jgi:hypothetical protein